MLYTPCKSGWSASYAYCKLCDCLLKVSLCLFLTKTTKSIAAVETDRCIEVRTNVRQPALAWLFRPPVGRGGNTRSRLGTTARVYPATAQDRARSDSREKASSSNAVTGQVRPRSEGDTAVDFFVRYPKGNKAGRGVVLVTLHRRTRRHSSDFSYACACQCHVLALNCPCFLS